MNEAKPLLFGEFGGRDDCISTYYSNNPSFLQAKYLHCYLDGLGAKRILVESNYFDRDYLDEFASFYCLSARGYPNICRRIHYFDSEDVTRELFTLACSGDKSALDVISTSYLGFSIIRPIPKTPLGRTVFKWYIDQTPDTPRVTNSSRNYSCHIAGLELTVNGLAWQQQDSGVAACATISLWTMLHSSAFDAGHSIPTTSKITKAAHENASLGKRVFPSHFLTTEQVLEAIKGQGLAPTIIKGELEGGYFSKEKFAATCASFLRSGYPLLVIGHHTEKGPITIGHAICAVGFREPSPIIDQSQLIELQDAGTNYIYIHDDNIGPNVRFAISSEEITIDKSVIKRCLIRVEDPEYLDDSKILNADSTGFAPQMLIAAVHEDLRVSSDSFFKTGIQLTSQIASALKVIYEGNGNDFSGLVFSTRFILNSDYMQQELPLKFEGQPDILADVRLKLQENVAPMSLHLGLIRIALPDSSAIIDILYDTTDSDVNQPTFCHIVYDRFMREILNGFNADAVKEMLGVSIDAF